MKEYLKWDEQTITDLSDANVNTMYDRGFVFTRPSEGLMQQTRSVRINLSKFELSSENRRIIRKTDGLQLVPCSLPLLDYDWSIGKLAKDFYETKFGPGVFTANKVKELLTAGRKDFNTLFQYVILNEVKDPSEDRDSSATPQNDVVGYCIAVETNEIVHYSYPFYILDSKFEIPNIGLGMMTRAIVWAKEKGKKYIYLGSAQRESDTYKFQFSGVEIFETNIWTKK